LFCFLELKTPIHLCEKRSFPQGIVIHADMPAQRSVSIDPLSLKFSFNSLHVSLRETLGGRNKHINKINKN
jgi:hypothetical protein